jgi:hypothetical protein
MLFTIESVHNWSGYENKEMEASAEVQKCRSAEVQKCRSAEVQKCRRDKG